MEYNYSYNVLIERFKAFADGHYLIKRFTHGQIDLADMDNDEQYPFMHVTPDVIKPANGSITFGFHVMFADIPRDKETKAEYQREVISDCVRLAQDLIGEIKNGLTLFGYDVQMANEPTLEPFMEEYKNTLTGIAFTIELEVPYNWSACDIPANWTVGGSSSGGSGAQLGVVFKVNGVNNAVQNVLDLVEGAGITIVDNGDGSVTFTSTGGVGSVAWGDITGTLSAQTDLQNALDDKADITSLGATAFSNDYNDLDNLPTIPAAQIQSDWNQSNNAALDFIKNKPTIPSAQGLQDVINTDNVLTTDDTIDCNTYALTIDDTANFTVNSTSKVDINVNSTAELSIDSTSVSIIEQSTSTVSSVIANTTNVSLSSSNGANNTAVSASPTALKVITPNVTAASATVGQVLALSNVNGTVEYINAPSTSGFVPYTGATQDVDLDANKLSAESVYIEGTNGAGHLHLKHQSADATATGQSTALWADNNGDIKWKNDGNYKTTLKSSSNTADRVYTFPNETAELMPRNAAITGATKTKITYDSDGLITSGSDIVATDISDSTTVGQNLVKLPNPSAVRYLRINADNMISALTLAQLKSDLSVSSAIMANAYTNTGTGFESLTDLSFAVTANKTYKWRATLTYTSTAAITFSLTGPATPTFNNYRFTASNAATTNTVFNATAYDTGTNAAASSNGLCTADGIIRVTASGTVTVRIRCATIGAMTVRAGSIIEFEEVL